MAVAEAEAEADDYGFAEDGRLFARAPQAPMGGGMPGMGGGMSCSAGCYGRFVSCTLFYSSPLNNPPPLPLFSCS